MTDSRASLTPGSDYKAVITIAIRLRWRYDYDVSRAPASIRRDSCSEISCNVKWNVYLAMEIPDRVSFVSGQNSDEIVRSCELSWRFFLA